MAPASEPGVSLDTRSLEVARSRFTSSSKGAPALAVLEPREEVEGLTEVATVVLMALAESPQGCSSNFLTLWPMPVN